MTKLINSKLKHESYDSNNQANDIAILTLSSDVVLNNYIQIGCLPGIKSNTYPGTNVDVYAAGWGRVDYDIIAPDSLYNVKLTAYDASSCSKVGKLNKGQICAGLIIKYFLNSKIK